ncbi:MAG: glycosyltransferase [Akkermansia sp.]
MSLCAEHPLKIALLADFPLWKVSDKFVDTHQHYAVWLEALYEALKLENALDVHWIIVSKNVSQRETFQSANQTFHVVPRTKKTIGLYTGYLYERIRVKKVLKEIAPDLVHAWGTEDVYALCGKSFKGAKLLSVQGALNAYCERGPMPTFVKRQAFWERIVMRAYHYFSAESPWCRDRIREQNSEAQVTLVEYGVESRFFDVKRQLSDQPTCLYAGTVTELKGISELVQAFSSPELAGITLRIAGGGCGEFYEEMKRLSTPNIIWLGRIDREGMMHELASAWCLVHPSYADSSPNIVKESRVMGLPVVTTAEGGQTQYVTDAKSGFIVPVHDARSIVTAVLKVVESKEKSISMGEFEQGRCREALAPHLTANKFTSLYREILSTHNAIL